MDNNSLLFWDKLTTKAMWIAVATLGYLTLEKLLKKEAQIRKSRIKRKVPDFKIELINKLDINKPQDFERIKQILQIEAESHELSTPTRTDKSNNGRKVKFQEGPEEDTGPSNSDSEKKSKRKASIDAQNSEEVDTGKVDDDDNGNLTPVAAQAASQASTKSVLNECYRLLRSNEFFMIVFTGGPCGGKTTTITYCAERFKDKGLRLVCVPEAASLIFSSGGVLNMETYSKYEAVLFQKCLFKLQLGLENCFAWLLLIRTNQKEAQKPCGRPMVLCDRGLMDGSAYLAPEQWTVLLEEVGMYETEIKDNRYDMVVHLCTAAKGAEAFYTLHNNEARSESIQAAVELDDKIIKAWANHPKYVLISNEMKDFLAKMKQAEAFIIHEVVGEHPEMTNIDYNRKYLLTGKNNLFESFVKYFKVEIFKLTDIILQAKNVEGKESCDYIRQREHGSRITFLRGERRYTGKEESYYTIKQGLMWDEFTSFSRTRSPEYEIISRERCMTTVGDSNL
jgi:predicted ATPase